MEATGYTTRNTPDYINTGYGEKIDYKKLYLEATVPLEEKEDEHE